MKRRKGGSCRQEPAFGHKGFKDPKDKSFPEKILDVFLLSRNDSCPTAQAIRGHREHQFQQQLREFISMNERNSSYRRTWPLFT